MRRSPPRLATRVLRRCLPDDVVGASIVGDLREEFEGDRGRWRRLRYVYAALALAVSYRASRGAGAIRAWSRRWRPSGGGAGEHARPSMIHTAIEDFHDAWRGVRRRPRFALAGAGLLACGLAASSTVFSFVEAVLLRPLPMIEDADRLVRIQERATNAAGTVRFHNVIPRDMERIAAAAPSLEATAAMLGQFDIPYSDQDGTVRIPAVQATAGFFDVIGVRPVLGRPFTAEDERPGAPRVAVLSHAAWLRLFGGQAEALGSVLTLNRQPCTVIGVMPPGFVFPDAPDVYIPLPHSAFTTRFHVATGLARLRPETPLERARSEVDAAIAALARDEPEARHGEGARVLRWRASVTERVQPALRMLVAAAAFVLLLAAVNLGGLLAERSSARTRELFVRSSLGASGARVARLLAAEAVIIAAAGALLGLLITALTLRTVVALSPADLPFRDAVRLDGRVLAFTAALALLAGMAAGLVPAFRIRRSALVVREHSAGGARLTRGAGLLVTAQIAIATVLVSGAGLLVRSFVTAVRVDPGIRTDGILTAGVTLPPRAYDAARERAFFEEVLETMRGIPGVTSAEVGHFAPLAGSLPVDLSRAPDGERHRVSLNAVSPGMLPLLGVPLLDGRGFDPRDDETRRPVAVLSRMAAADLFPGESPVGRVLYGRLFGRDQAYTIVGVVDDVRQEGPLEDAPAMMYVPFRQNPMSAGTFVIAGPVDPAAAAASLRAAVRRLDPGIPFDRVQTLGAFVDESLAQPRFYSVVVGVFGALALMLAVSGLYAVVAFAARRRMFEFGVRSALGARPVDNLWLVYRQGLRLSLGGVAAGLLVAFQVTRLLRTLLYRTEPADPATLTLAGGLTLVIALAAVIMPALRAARADPALALRAE